MDKKFLQAVPETQDLNVMEKMLAKGDSLKPKYENYDFSKFSTTQHFWLRKLTWFSAYR